MSSLRWLSIEGNSFTTLEPLLSLTELGALYIGWNEGITDLASLASMTQLNALGLNNTGLSDISWIYNLTNLGWLSMGSNGLGSLELDLANFPQLHTLYVNWNQLSQVALQNAQNLSGLSLEGNQLTADDFLSEMPNLNWLDIGNNQLTSLTLSDLPNLNQVNAWNNQISTFEMTNVPNLNWIYLGNNNLSDLTDLGAFLANQPNNNGWWFEVDLQSNDIVDVSPLADLDRMGSLNLDYNAIEDVTPLSGMVNLWQLNLYDNNIAYLNGTFDTWTNGTYINLSENPLICSEVDAARANGDISIDFNTPCYEDRDGDGVPDYLDGFPDDPAAGRDTDGDGLPDTCDAVCQNAGYTEDQDDDGDTYNDDVDVFPLDATEWADSDGDGVGDNRDAYPDDPTRWSLEFYEALNPVVDDNSKILLGAPVKLGKQPRRCE